MQLIGIFLGFRALADTTYAQSDLAKAWDANLLKRVGDIQ